MHTQINRRFAARLERPYPWEGNFGQLPQDVFLNPPSYDASVLGRLHVEIVTDGIPPAVHQIFHEIVDTCAAGVSEFSRRGGGGDMAAASVMDALYTKLQFMLPPNVRHCARLEISVSGPGDALVRIVGPHGFEAVEPMRFFPSQGLINKLLVLA